MPVPSSFIPDGDLTLNYLDTKGLPLTPDHLSSATALVARMIGSSPLEDKQMLRQAQIAKYLNLLYEDAFQEWQKRNHHQIDRRRSPRHASPLQRFRAEHMPPGTTVLEAFADFRTAAQVTDVTIPPPSAVCRTFQNLGSTIGGRAFSAQFDEAVLR
jgi:hypothetical protein